MIGSSTLTRWIKDGCAFLGGALMLFFSIDVEAQTDDNGLLGLSKMDLVIEDLSEQSAKCGLTRDGLHNATMFQASFAKFLLKDFDTTDDPMPVFYLRVATVYFDRIGLCVSSVNVQVYDGERVTLDFSGRQLFEDVQLWNSDEITSSSSGEHAREVGLAIENLTKHFITDWNLDNKSSN